MRSPSNAFQTRPGECEFLDGDERRRLLSSEKALTDIMSQTLKHAASSMFVTSFTTSAAFFTNMLTKISFVQVFGVFTGTCILLYFFITVTAIAAFAVSPSNAGIDLVVITERFSFQVIYEKYIVNITARLPLIRLLSSSSSDASTNVCRRFAMLCRNIRIRLFSHVIPRLIIQCRYVLVLVLLAFGIVGTLSTWSEQVNLNVCLCLGLLGVFYYPKLQVPSTQKVAFFTRDNPMETFEFSMKMSFNGYMKAEKRMFAYPSVSFIFGIRDIDDGYIFDMSDRGHLHLMPLHLERRQTMEFFKTFISDLGTRTDLFSSNYDLEKDFEAFYQVETVRVQRVVCISRSFLIVNHGAHSQVENSGRPSEVEHVQDRSPGDDSILAQLEHHPDRPSPPGNGSYAELHRRERSVRSNRLHGAEEQSSQSNDLPHQRQTSQSSRHTGDRLLQLPETIQ